MIDVNAGFGPDNLPYCVFEHQTVPTIGVRLGDRLVDLRLLVENGMLPGECGAATLNPLMAAGPDRWSEVRGILVDLITRDDPAIEAVSRPIAEVELLLPFEVADYVDFYSSQQHAENLGRMFRPDAEPLLPNWKHLPVGYHGRAGTIVISGTDIKRPSGQRREPDGSITFGPSRRLDIELELGYVIGGDSALGEPVPIGEAADHIFGFFLVNDWSARDIQAWEYVPLGPFLGKSFATSISPWVVPAAALEPFRVDPPPQNPEPLSYLRGGERWGLDLQLEVAIKTPGLDTFQVISVTDFRNMYWTPVQQIAHLTVNGASLRTGDVCASGTVSGPDPGTYGSLIELSWNGQQPIELADGSVRTFLEDGDRISLRGRADDGVTHVGLGEVVGTVVA